MTPDLAAEISALLLVGMCGAETQATCEHCQRRLRAVEQVRALVRDSRGAPTTPAEIEAQLAAWLCAEHVQPTCKHCATTLRVRDGVRQMADRIAELEHRLAVETEQARDAHEDRARIAQRLSEVIAADGTGSYAAGRRDGIAVAAMQNELARDVLRAELAYERAATGSPASDAAYDVLEEAVRVYIAAGCPGLEGE